jgi:hypothetical protein
LNRLEPVLAVTKVKAEPMRVEPVIATIVIMAITMDEEHHFPNNYYFCNVPVAIMV